MSTYSIERELPTCVVTKGLLEELQARILQYAADIEGDNHKSDRYSVLIIDEYGKEELGSIKDYRQDMFPSDTVSISLRYRSTYGSPTDLSMSISFSIFSKFTKIAMSVTCDTARETVLGRVGTLFDIVQRHSIKPQLSHMHHELASIAISSICTSTIIFSFTPLLLHESLRSAYSRIYFTFFVFAVGMCALLHYKRNLPYTYFKSHAADAKLDQVKWVSRTFLGGFAGVTILRLALYFTLGI
jgi:hypothetical protein